MIRRPYVCRACRRVWCVFVLATVRLLVTRCVYCGAEAVRAGAVEWLKVGEGAA